MQALDSKKHQSMLSATRQFEELLKSYRHLVPEGQDEIIMENIAELEGTYDYYCLLLKELEDCIDTYKEQQDSLQRTMFPYVRRMITQERNKKGCI